MIITEAPTYSQDTFVMQVINAVLAIGKATLGRFEQKCNRSAEAICEKFGTAFGEEFTEALDNVCFTGIDGQDFAIRDGESFRAYNFFYWQEDGTPIKIGASGSEGRSYTPDSKHVGFPEDGYYDKLPQSECSKKFCGYFCRRCRLGRNRNKLNSKCWDCSQARREGYPKCDACVPYGEEFKCFNCVEN
ncbi:unnamed protein product [Owenia fusiformis]|uniref:Uncharacterized protein n=1 Tax=Owenia fusiformis TaxID=6347 RepID=A0A8S4N7J5_OWEFU|nr:unnamed protein product [Owenia fusiformis]